MKVGVTVITNTIIVNISDPAYFTAHAGPDIKFL